MRRDPLTPNPPAMAIADALGASPALGRLGERMRLSGAYLAAVAPAIATSLAAHVRAGPVDDEGWSLLCANASVAAKLRQLVPHLEQRLKDSGYAVATIRVKVLPDNAV